MWELLWALFAVILVLILAYLFTKYAAGRLGNGMRFRKGKMTVLEQLPIGRDQKLLLVRVGENVYWLGVTSGGITRLEKISGQEWNKLEQDMGEQVAEGGQKLNFQEALKKVLEQRKNRGGRG